MAYDKNMTGTLNPNDKGDNPKRPDWRGQCEIDGAKYWISAWERDGQNGRFFSLKFERKVEKPSAPASEYAPNAVILADIPF